MEGTGSRMSSMGKSELLLGKIFTQQETLDNIDAVNMESLSDMIERIINFENMAVTVLGSVNEGVKTIPGMMV